MDVEIFLLMDMVCDDELKLPKLAQTDLSFEAARTRAREVSNHFRFGPDQFEKLRVILDVDIIQSSPGENPSLRYRLKLWPDFYFVVVSEDGHWYSSRFVRVPESPLPKIDSPLDIEPWSVSLGDIEALFRNDRCTDGFPPWEAYVFEDSSGLTYGAGFSHGLLQDIERIE